MKNKLIGYSILLSVVAALSAGMSYLVSVKAANNTDANNPDVANARKWLHEAELSSDQLEKLEPAEAGLRRDLASMQILLAQERITVCNLIKDNKGTPEILQSHVNRIGQLETAQQDYKTHFSTHVFLCPVF
jgi:hypothetical protein